MSKIFRIQPSEFVDNMWEGGHMGTKLPYPFYVNGEGLVGRQDVWNGDPYRVLGFARNLRVHEVNLTWDEAVQDPSRAVGMYLVTWGKVEGIGTHETAVSSIELLPEKTP